MTSTANSVIRAIKVGGLIVISCRSPRKWMLKSRPVSPRVIHKAVSKKCLRGSWLLDTSVGWMTQKCLLFRSRSQSGGYHTVFRSVKQVTFKLDDKIVKFSTRFRPSRDKDAGCSGGVVR